MFERPPHHCHEARNNLDARDEVNKALDAAFSETPWPFDGELEQVSKGECASIFDDFFVVEGAVVRYLLPYWLKMAIDPVDAHLVGVFDMVSFLNALEKVTPDLKLWLTSLGGPLAGVLYREDVVWARKKGEQLQNVSQAESCAVLKWLLYVKNLRGRISAGTPQGSELPSVCINDDDLRMAIAYWCQRAGVSVWEPGISDYLKTEE